MQCYANLYHKRFQFFKSYTPFIQCLTENNGRYTRCFQLANILGTTHSATGYKVKVGMHFQHLFIQRYGRTLQHTVAIDVGTDDFTNTFPDIIFQKREQFASTLILPTVDGNLMIFYISSENYSLRAVCLQPVTETFGILYGNATATICAPLSNAMTKSSSLFTPPPKSITKEVREAICSSVR